MSHKLLIVDDEMPNIRLLERVFREKYHCLTASSGEEAIKLLDQHEVAVIITDQRMPQMTGIELLKKSVDRRPHMVRILLTGYTDLEALVEAVNCGLVYMYVSKPWNNEDLKLRISRAMEHYEQNKRQHALAAANDRLTARIKEMKGGLVQLIAGLLKMKDEFTYARGTRVSQCATAIGKNFAMQEELLEDLSAAAFLHELGVLGIPDNISTDGVSDSSLSPLDRKPDCTPQLLSTVPELRDVADIIRFQRENFDGSGSPIGLIGDQIPIGSRVLRVASDYDALMHPRGNEKGVSHREAVETLQRGAGRKFDQQVMQGLANLSANGKNNLREPQTNPMDPD